MLIDRYFDPVALAIVLGGILVATLLRSGRSELAAACRALANIRKPVFSAVEARAALSPQVRRIESDGLLCAPLLAIPDRDLADAVAAMLTGGSANALMTAHEMQRARRQRETQRAVAVFAQAAELSPVFGLAGTLVALSGMPAEGVAAAALGGVIGQAVLTTLYGVVAAHLVFAPIARAIARRAQESEDARQELVDWIVLHAEAGSALTVTVQPLRPGVRSRVA